MIANRSVPTATVIPERLRIGDHRAQLVQGDGAVILTARSATSRAAVLVRVADVDQHHEQARKNGARILQPPADHPYGERQYSAEDLGGHVWTFSQSIADVDPASWGGILR